MKYAVWRTEERPHGMPDGSVYFSVRHQEYGTLLCFPDKATRAEFLAEMNAVPVNQRTARIMYGSTALETAKKDAERMWGNAQK